MLENYRNQANKGKGKEPASKKPKPKLIKNMLAHVDSSSNSSHHLRKQHILKKEADRNFRLSSNLNNFPMQVEEAKDSLDKPPAQIDMNSKWVDLDILDSIDEIELQLIQRHQESKEDKINQAKEFLSKFNIEIK